MRHDVVISNFIGVQERREFDDFDTAYQYLEAKLLQEVKLRKGEAYGINQFIELYSINGKKFTRLLIHIKLNKWYNHEKVK